jgi:hypothetical protein
MKEKIKHCATVAVAFVRKLWKKIRDTHTVVQIASFSFIFGIVFIIFLTIIVTPHMRRSIFCFPSASGKTVTTEIRYLPVARDRSGKAERYISDLLLGPETPSLIPLFDRKTRILDCFVRKNILYVNLSSAALLPGPNSASTEEGCALFKKNVCTNFRNIAKIYLYVDGIEVYSEKPSADVK